MKTDYKKLSERAVAYISSLVGNSIVIELFNPADRVFAVHAVWIDYDLDQRKIIYASNLVTSEQFAYRSFLNVLMKNNSDSDVCSKNIRSWVKRDFELKMFVETNSYEELDFKLAVLGF